jgi:Fic family protein
LVKEKTAPRDRDEQEIAGYRDILKTIHENYKYISLRPEIILQLHRDLLAYADTSYGGKFKSMQNYISETNEDGIVFTRFTPSSPLETPEAMEKICNEFQEALNMQIIDPLVLIPIFICDFLCIHPFLDGNGRMSRLLTTLLLYKSGYMVGRYISLEKKVENTKDTYYDVLGQISSGWHENRSDYRGSCKKQERRFGANFKNAKHFEIGSIHLLLSIS